VPELRAEGGAGRAAAASTAAHVQAFPAYVGIGSNLRDPVKQVRAACQALAALPSTLLVRCSSLFGSHPLGPSDQPDFCNAVAGILTELTVSALHSALRVLEQQMGREPSRQRWGPRVIDLDLLAYAELRRVDPELTVPHPGIAVRHFVLQPWREISPDYTVPGLGRVSTLAARVSTEGLWKIT
jgi:2-amino-4-hydroxy-6-hydroxymethyldihydropteridine diphosphokinase